MSQAKKVNVIFLLFSLFVISPIRCLEQHSSGMSEAQFNKAAALLLGCSYLYFRDDIKAVVDGVIEVRVIGKIHGQRPIDKIHEVVAPHFLNKPGNCLFYWKLKIKNKVEEIRRRVEGFRILGKTIERPTFSQRISLCLNDVVAVLCLVGILF